MTRAPDSQLADRSKPRRASRTPSWSATRPRARPESLDHRSVTMALHTTRRTSQRRRARSAMPKRLESRKPKNLLGYDCGKPVEFTEN
jgi:hypothetical protein